MRGRGCRAVISFSTGFCSIIKMKNWKKYFRISAGIHRYMNYHCFSSVYIVITCEGF